MNAETKNYGLNVEPSSRTIFKVLGYIVRSSGFLSLGAKENSLYDYLGEEHDRGFLTPAIKHLEDTGATKRTVLGRVRATNK